MYIIFDTETTGLPRNWNAPITDTDNWPRVIQIAWQLHGDMGELIESKDYIIRPDGFNIPYDSEQIHGISTDLALEKGVELKDVLEEFNEALKGANFVVGQNVKFDLNVWGCEYHRLGVENKMTNLPVLDTCTEVTAKLCQIPGGRGGSFKLPNLSELHEFLFQESFVEAHNATADVEATTRCFFELIRRGSYTAEELQQEPSYIQAFQKFNPNPIELIGLEHLNLKEESRKIKKLKVVESGPTVDKDKVLEELKDFSFAHLHNHSQFSILQSTIEIDSLVAKAGEMNMKAVALTDTGNMMAAFHFERAVANFNKSIQAKKAEAEENGEVFEHNELMPIIGCEFFVCRDLTDKKNKDNGYQVVFLAKNKNGYQNLIKLASIAFTEGKYYVPRIDKTVIEKYSEDIFVLTGNLYGEVPSLVLNVGEKQAEEALLWWKSVFKENLYVEILRHGQENEDRVNEVLIKLARKHEVKLIAANSTYYIDKEDAESHDLLLCVKDGELVSTPKGRGRGFRYALDNDEYYFKSQEEMKELFLDIPDAIKNIDGLIEQCEHYALARDVLLPAFDIPEEFQDKRDLEDGGKRGENNFLRHITYEGAKKRYGEITPEIKERIDFELSVIENTGYPGYFLIVEDFIRAAREMGVSVGPGRGSAAGSVVAYCTWITNIDPMKYNLLFERFLNPERISMPDIDIDFDDEGRGKVMQYVIDKYGANQVAQIITYGTMAAKSSIRDVARVLDLSLAEADRIAKLVPDIKLKKLFGLSELELKEKLNNQDDVNRALELKRLAEGDDLPSRVINQARKLEGSVRNTGIHACGVIITPDDITNYVPVALAKDSEMYCTQFDNSVAEDAGLLKMDFLGLKTLSLIKHAVENVKLRHNIELVPDDFPIDDEVTYQLFQRGETVGVFQYESDGMQKYLKELKPTVFADLIAMNALYRPGPLEYIPTFIKRKHGEEEIVYDIEDCEEHLAETYGITVYQEQVMLLSQKLADFTKGQADTLRKAMGKKQIAVLDKMKPIFLENGAKNGHDVEKLEKIWKDWEAFASYAFNKSHSTCYAWIAYQTAYLKANYPAEYMASVLSNNMNDIKSVTFFMEECRRMGIDVLGPDVNESVYRFTVNQNGQIRFGLGAVKGLGQGPVKEIIEKRKEGGNFINIFDFVKRVSLRICNKKALDSLAYAGGFDSFPNVHRAQYFQEDAKGQTFLENVIKFGSGFQDSQTLNQASLFDGDSGVSLPEPTIPVAEEWSNIYKLNKEKEVVGVFISGHPLDDFKVEIKAFCNGNVGMLHNKKENLGKDLLIAGVITEAEHRTTSKGDPFGTIVIEDYNDSYKEFLWREDYLKFKHFLTPNTYVVLHGRIQPKRWGDEFEFKINSIERLHDLLANRAKEIRISIPVKELDQIKITDLQEVFVQNPGKIKVHFSIYDSIEDIKVEMPSRTVKIELTDQLFKKLDELRLNYSIK